MRRLLFSVAALCLASIVGCYHTAGVCDCDLDDNICCRRAPWCFPECGNRGCANGGCTNGCGTGNCGQPGRHPVSQPVINDSAPAVKELPRLGPPKLEE